MPVPEDKRPPCRLVGENGNVFSIIALVGSALKKAGLKEEAEEWKKASMSCESYDEVLQLLFSYVEPY